MTDRIDALGRRPARTLAFTGAILDEDLDEDLQTLVTRAAEELDAPIALVSLVLEHTQFFRAHIGLPEELVRTRSTDRDASFCQFVVRDGRPFAVSDAALDEQVPQDLVKRYGVRSYLGVPLVANSELVGALCVLDVNSRGFDRNEIDKLEAIAQNVNIRLAQLATARSSAETRDRAARPAFAELRNLSMPLTAGLRHARLLATDLLPVADAASRIEDDGPNSKALSEATESLTELRDMLGELSATMDTMVDAIVALETSNLTSPVATLLEPMVKSAITLARHHLRPVGGLVAESPPNGVRLAIPLATGTTVLTACISEVALRAGENGSRDLKLKYGQSGDYLQLLLTGGLQPEAWQEVGSLLSELTRHLATVAIDERSDALEMRFSIFPARGPAEVQAVPAASKCLFDNPLTGVPPIGPAAGADLTES